MKTDARVRYTQMMLKKSFLTLLAKQKINQISVKEICGLSELNRATFYTHYRNVYDLLDHIEEEFYQKVESILKTSRQSSFNDVLSEVLSVINDNAELCKIIFSENGDKKFLRKLSGVSLDLYIRDNQQQFPKATEKQLKTTYTFLVNGAIAIIEDWINSGMHENLEEIGRYLRNSSDPKIIGIILGTK